MAKTPIEKVYITDVNYQEDGVTVVLSNGAELLGIMQATTTVSPEYDMVAATLTAQVLPSAEAAGLTLLAN